MSDASETIEQFKRIGQVYSAETLMGRPMAPPPSPPLTKGQAAVAELDALGAEGPVITVCQLGLGHPTRELDAMQHGATMRMMLHQPATDQDRELERVQAEVAALAQHAADHVDEWAPGLRERMTADVIRDRKQRNAWLAEQTVGKWSPGATWRPLYESIDPKDCEPDMRFQRVNVDALLQWLREQGIDAPERTWQAPREARVYSVG
jgi:hypothetical protein